MLSIVLPALNEQKYLAKTFFTIKKKCLKLKIKHEFIIVNDGSTDNTENVAKKIIKNNKNVIYINNKKNLGIAASFMKALKVCNGERITVFPADNYSHKILIYNLLKNYKKADLVISYTLNTEERSNIRNTLSTFYNFFYNFCFKSHFKYINGSGIYNVQKLKKIKIITQGYSVFAEINIKFCKLGYSIHETWGIMNNNINKSSALNLLNLIKIIIDFILLIFEIKILNKKKYKHKFIRKI